MSKRTEIRGTKKQWLAGKAVALLMRAVGLTLRIRVEDARGRRFAPPSGDPLIWIFWHNGLFAAPLSRKKIIGKAPASALASASRDGAVIESVVASFGIKTVRGSSSRRGVAALIALKKAHKSGDHLFVTPDGPRGPRYHLQPGVIKLAQSSGVPIIPLHFRHSSSWRLKSWDRFHIPKPFSTVTIRVGEPILVPQALDDAAFEAQRQHVENVLREGVDDFTNKN